MRNGKDPNLWIENTCKKLGELARAFRILLTPELAAEFLGHMAKNRPLRPRRVQFYREKIKSGDWHYTGQPIIFNDQGEMIDGQHRCQAVIEENEQIEVLVVLDVSSESFRFLDQGAPRTGGDFLDGVPSRAAIAAALGWLWLEERGIVRRGNHGEIVRHMSPSDAPIMLERYPQIVDCMRKANPCRSILGLGMLSYAYFRCARANEEKAEEFFQGLATGEGLQAGSPLLLLRNRLILNRQSKASLPSHELMALFIKAWTKYLSGQTIKSLAWRNNDAAPEPFPVWPGPRLIQVHANGEARVE